MSKNSPAIGDVSDKGIYAGEYFASNKNDWGFHFPPSPVIERSYHVYVSPEDLKAENAKGSSLLTPDYLPTLIPTLTDGAKLNSIWAPLASWEDGKIDGKWFLPPRNFMTEYVYPLSKIESLKSSFEIVAKPRDLKTEPAFKPISGPDINYEDYEFGKIRKGHYLSAEKIGPNSSNESPAHVCMRMDDGALLVTDEWTPTRVRLVKLEPI